MTDVKGRTAFITGGANGIGFGIAEALAKAGVMLALADIDAGALQRAKAALQPFTPVETFVLDVRDRETYARVADEAERALGPVSLLFNNAGVASGAPAAKLTYELWDWAIGINLTGVINGIQTFLPRIIARGAGGHIVNTASGAGLAATTTGVLYSTVKFGVVGMSEALNAELSPADIGVSVLCPGPVATDIVTRTFDVQPATEDSAEARQKAKERAVLVTQYLKQGVSPRAVGDMVLKAIGENSLYIHTDRIMAEPVAARAKAILAAMPEA